MRWSSRRSRTIRVAVQGWTAAIRADGRLHRLLRTSRPFVREGDGRPHGAPPVLPTVRLNLGRPFPCLRRFDFRCGSMAENGRNLFIFLSGFTRSRLRGCLTASVLGVLCGLVLVPCPGGSAVADVPDPTDSTAVVNVSVGADRDTATTDHHTAGGCHLRALLGPAHGVRTLRRLR
ncbi:hypothetical protein SMALB_0346 [Streptomyces malaysiensis]|uniref:Uncharacterized protein n=1 Tax=Streptomyces malaysiensis TaxID=92644 RepID=A0A7X5WXA4_STRMQ|nr:hypothetical protein [Streptomyces malaysiensis]